MKVFITIILSYSALVLCCPDFDVYCSEKGHISDKQLQAEIDQVTKLLISGVDTSEYIAKIAPNRVKDWTIAAQMGSHRLRFFWGELWRKVQVSRKIRKVRSYCFKRQPTAVSRLVNSILANVIFLVMGSKKPKNRGWNLAKSGGTRVCTRSKHSGVCFVQEQGLTMIRKLELLGF